MNQTIDLDLLVAEIAARVDEIEKGRRLPPDLAATLAGAGLFRLCVPRSLGGGETEVGALLSTIERLSAVDGSAGWCVMIGATTGLLAASLPLEHATEIYGANDDTVTGGVFAPKGKAVAVDGGYRVTGRWPFASGSQHCAWLTGGCVVEGVEGQRMLFFPAAEVEIIDTWTVAGLSGSGSHDMAVHDVFVPAGREVELGVTHPREPGPLYRFPVFGLLALGVSAVALGIAAAAVDDLLALAGGKTPTGGGRLLAERPSTQAEVGRATAALDAARCLVGAAVNHAWDAASTEGHIDTRSRARLRMAATHATRTAADVVDAMYDLGGGTSIYAASPLQRRFRDVHVVTQHAMVAPPTFEQAGRVLLGVPGDTLLL